MRIASIFTHLINFCWSLLKWSLLLVVLSALGAGGYLYFQLDDEIRRQVEVRFANHYRDFDVKISSARFDPDRGIAIDGLSLTPKTTDGTVADPVLTIDEMYLAGNLRIEQLVTNKLQIADVVVRRAKLRMVRKADGIWNTAALLPLPHFSDESPRITIEDASATIQYGATPSGRPWSLGGVNLKLLPVMASDEGPTKAERFQIEGSATGPPAREFRLAGELGATDGSLNLEVMAGGLEISSELLANLPSGSATQFNSVDVLAQANVTLNLARVNGDSPLVWSAKFNVDRGRLRYPTLPDPLTEVSLSGQADPKKLSIDRMVAKCGPANLTLAMNRAGWSSDAPLAVSAKVVGFVLTDKLQTTLPESYARMWQRFRPTGPVDADVQLTYDGEDWKPTVRANCRGVSLTDADKFPYVVEQASGEVSYQSAANGKPDHLRLNLTGYGANRPVKIDVALSHLAPAEPQGPAMGEGVASAANPSDGAQHSVGFRGVRYARRERVPYAHPIGYVEISGADIPLHDRLLDALPPKGKELVVALQAQGAIDFRFRAEWKDLGQRHAETTLEIPLKECRIRYAPFPFPVQHVNGLVKAENWRWTLNDITGRGSNESTIVRCQGTAVPHDSGCEADLVFEATNVPLDDILKDALPAAGKQAWSELRPQGSIDFTAHATRQPNELEPNVEVVLRPRERTVSIEPLRFPYRLNEVEGTATYRRGQVNLQHIVAKHARSVYSAESGIWQVGAGGGWQCSLTNLNVDRLSADRDLLVALPPGVQIVLEKLQPSGTIGVYKSNLSFATTPQNDGLAASWDVNLECQQAALQGAFPVRGINGGIRLIGQTDGRTAVGSGELALDSILIKDVQLTNVRGPFWTDSARCLLGEPACQQRNQPARRMTADAYGGSLSTNIEIAHGPNPSYKLDVHLGAADLGRFSNERLSGASNLNGKVSGKLAVAGTGTSMQTLRGIGELHVVDANIYQIPPLVAVLSVLRNKTPDTTAFNRCDMEFTIQGEHIQFEHLNLTGDAVSLYGKGEIDFSRRLDLVFYTLIGPADLPIPLWKTIAGHVSQQGFQLKVGGTFDYPTTERKPFPAINDMLDQMKTEIQDSASTISPTTVRYTHPPGK